MAAITSMWYAQLSASSKPSAAVATNGTNRRYLKLPMSSHGNLYAGPGLSAMSGGFVDVTYVPLRSPAHLPLGGWRVLDSTT